MNDDARPSLSRAISRRRFLAAAAALASAAGAAVLTNCGDDRRRTLSGSTTPGATATPAITRARSLGGRLRVYNFDALPPDSLDPHLTQFGPIANVHAAVYSRLLRYDVASGTLAPDLADGMPEQPDETTYVVRIRQGVRFHDSARTRYVLGDRAGRELTADDVRYSIARQMEGGSPQSKRFFRRGQWSVIDSIEARDRYTVVIKTKQPVAPFLSFLAGPHAFIIARESVNDRDELSSDAAMMGTGPFMLDSFEPNAVARLIRNPAWFAQPDRPEAGYARPFIDGYDAFWNPQEDVFQRVMFDRRVVDGTNFVDPKELDATYDTNLGDIALQETDAWGVLASRLLLDREPFRDDRARRALHLAVDRQKLINAIYPPIDGRPSALMSGPIAPGAAAWALAGDELSRTPGYRTAPEQRGEDIAEARRLWSAAFGDGSGPQLRALFAGFPRNIPDRASTELRLQLRESLGAEMTGEVDATGHTAIAAGLRRNLDGAAQGAITMTFMLEDGGIDLDDWLYGRFRSGQPDNTMRLHDAQLDEMLDRSRRAFDNDERAQLGRDIQEYLLANVNARVEYCAPVERRLMWGYVRNSTLAPWYGLDQGLADVWLDDAHPAWQGRPPAPA
ncbi:MAG TPA: ABC transporter substrate-binding protein [Dehalococcoidia bacterium]|nr:ABC transporter substrate-binding protein [Dehalococcoidia bacterium]